MSNVPFSPGGKAALVLVPKQDDPDVPASLISAVRTWHRGKQVNIKGGERILAPWIAIECIDTDLSYTIWTKSDVIPESDDDDVAADVWEHLVAWVRSRGDSMIHNVMARCLFAHPDGPSGDDFWAWSLTIDPHAQMQVGSPGFHGKHPLANRNEQHQKRDIVEQGLDMIRMAFTGYRDLINDYRQKASMDQSEIQKQRDRDEARETRDRQMVLDGRKHAIDAYTAKGKILAIHTLVQKLGGLGPLAAITVGRVVGRYFDKKKSPREERAYRAFRVVIDKLTKEIKTKEEFLQVMKEFGIEGELLADVEQIAGECLADKELERIEEEALGNVKKDFFTKTPKVPIDDPGDPFAGELEELEEKLGGRPKKKPIDLSSPAPSKEEAPKGDKAAS